MKRYSRELVTAFFVIGSAFLGFQLQGSDDVEERIENLEDRVSVLERQVEGLGGSSTTSSEEYVIDLQVNLGGSDGGIWISTGERSCQGARGAADFYEGFEIVVRDEQDREVGVGYFQAGRQTAFGCVIPAELSVEEADYYYLSVGP